MAFREATGLRVLGLNAVSTALVTSLWDRAAVAVTPPASLPPFPLLSGKLLRASQTPQVALLWGHRGDQRMGTLTLRREIRGLAFNTYTERAKHQKGFLKGTRSLMKQNKGTGTALQTPKKSGPTKSPGEASGGHRSGERSPLNAAPLARRFQSL